MIKEAFVCALLSVNKRYVRSGHCQCRQWGFPHPPSPGTCVEVVYNWKRFFLVCPPYVLYQCYLLIIPSNA